MLKTATWWALETPLRRWGLRLDTAAVLCRPAKRVCQLTNSVLWTQFFWACFELLWHFFIPFVSDSEAGQASKGVPLPEGSGGATQGHPGQEGQTQTSAWRYARVWICVLGQVLEGKPMLFAPIVWAQQYAQVLLKNNKGLLRFHRSALWTVWLCSLFKLMLSANSYLAFIA